MNNTRKEKISAFLDGDMHRDELMSFSLSAEDDDARIAQRYQMMGDAMRGELSDASFVDVSVAVRAALADENIVEHMSKESEPVAAFSAGSRFSLSAWLRPAAGMAVAASVAVVMVVSLSSHQADSGLSAPLASNAPSARLENAAAAVVPVASKKKDNGEFNPYINQHLEYATQDSLQGRLPYVRAVSYDAGKAH